MKKNFTTQEKHLVLHNLKGNKNILDNKNTEKATENLKKQCWSESCQYRDSASSPGRNTGALDCDYLGYRRYVLLHLENLKIIHDTEGRHSRMPTVDGGPNDDIGTDMEENAPALVIEISDAFNSNFMKNHTGITSLSASEEKDPLLLVDFGLDLESIGPIVHPCDELCMYYVYCLPYMIFLNICCITNDTDGLTCLPKHRTIFLFGQAERPLLLVAY
ncbi:myb/SANT-like DNA-binding domain-containing protein [Phthorimaea operculella]|nr:myb/SANT-like DNA-binding domain-containing protein [Phthorimaea operculella]